jgi:hypothetical protein
VHRIVAKMLEERLAVDALEGNPAEPHSIEQPGGGEEIQVTTHQRGSAQHLHAFSDGAQLEPTVVGLPQHPFGSESAENPSERARIDARSLGDLCTALGPVAEDLRHIELRRHVEELRREESVEQPAELRCRARCRRSPLFPFSATHRHGSTSCSSVFRYFDPDRTHWSEG